MAKTAHWGLLPAQAIALLRQKEWDHPQHLKQRLLSKRAFPIEIALKAPTGAQALANLEHFHVFFKAWKSFAQQDAQWVLVQWQARHFKQLGLQDVPVKLIIPSLDVLVTLLHQQARFDDWNTKISALLQQEFVQAKHQAALFACLIEYLPQIENLSQQDWQLLISLLAQLKPDLGLGNYLRALPLQYVDTKFLEKHIVLVEAICDVLHESDVQNAGGLLSWLNCLDHPKGWLMVKPLCAKVKQELGGLPLFQLSTEVLLQFELPAQHIFVVENLQSGLALPDRDNSIVVCGGGKNIAWLKASWLVRKNVYYWGDIDSEGFAILSRVRQIIAHVRVLMMDEATVLAFTDKMVDEPDSIFTQPEYLTSEERALFNKLRDRGFTNRRLEQERISSDWVMQYLRQLK